MDATRTMDDLRNSLLAAEHSELIGEHAEAGEHALDVCRLLRKLLEHYRLGGHLHPSSDDQGVSP